MNWFSIAFDHIECVLSLKKYAGLWSGILNNHIWGVLITTTYADLKKWQWIGRRSDLIILFKRIFNVKKEKYSATLLYNLSINVNNKIKKKFQDPYLDKIMSPGYRYFISSN